MIPGTKIGVPFVEGLKAPSGYAIVIDHEGKVVVDSNGKVVIAKI